jgi:hypothetical protein
MDFADQSEEPGCPCYARAYCNALDQQQATLDQGQTAIAHAGRSPSHAHYNDQ